MQKAAAMQNPAITPSAPLRCPLLIMLTETKGETMAPTRDMELLSPNANDRTRVGYICKSSQESQERSLIPFSLLKNSTEVVTFECTGY